MRFLKASEKYRVLGTKRIQQLAHFSLMVIALSTFTPKNYTESSFLTPSLQTTE